MKTVTLVVNLLLFVTRDKIARLIDADEWSSVLTSGQFANVQSAPSLYPMIENVPDSLFTDWI